MNARIQNIENRLCAYCGAFTADCREHVIPVARIGYRSYDPDRSWIVWSCGTCNKLAGSEYFENLPLKALFIQARYRLKYKTLLASPVWSQEEINQLSGNLKRHIIVQEKKRQEIIRRLNYLENVGAQLDTYMMPWWMVEA